MGIIGRQAIIGSDKSICWYDILYRQERDDQGIYSDISITASVLDQLLHTFGIERVLGSYKGFLKVDTAFLSNDLVGALPKERFVLSLLQQSLQDKALPTLLNRLHAQGYRFAINDLHVKPDAASLLKPLLRYVDTVKIDALRSDPALALKLAEALQRHGTNVIAAKIENDSLMQHYQSGGVRYFQGYYIERPSDMESDSLSSDQESILSIRAQLQSDESVETIVSAIERHHVLALQLMQFINSSFFSFSRPITSIAQIVTLLGRKPLGDWLLLMMLSKHNQKGVNHPLLLMVINRTEIMQGLVRLRYKNPTRAMMHTAYLVGMLSLIHLLLGVDHRSFLRKLNVSSEIEEAMFEAQSAWGELLTMTRSIEHADLDALLPFVRTYAIDIEQINLLIVEAMERVNRFEEMLQSL